MLITCRYWTNSALLYIYTSSKLSCDIVCYCTYCIKEMRYKSITVIDTLWLVLLQPVTMEWELRLLTIFMIITISSACTRIWIIYILILCSLLFTLYGIDSSAHGRECDSYSSIHKPDSVIFLCQLVNVTLYSLHMLIL